MDTTCVYTRCYDVVMELPHGHINLMSFDPLGDHTSFYSLLCTDVKPWPNDANIFAQQMPTMLGINVGIVWPPMLGIVG